MAPADGCPQVVGPVADDRVRHSVHDQGNHQRHGDEPRRHTKHLAVIEQQEIIEAVILHALGHTAETEGDTRQPARFDRRVGITGLCNLYHLCAVRAQEPSSP